MVLLFYNSSTKNRTHDFGCSGTLIGRQFVLTAAHCVTGALVREKKGLKNVRLGEFNVKTEPDCIEEQNFLNCADSAMDIGIEKVIVHPGYDEKSADKLDDIALIKLRSNVTFSHYIMPICLPNKDDLVEHNGKENPMYEKIFWVSGCGRTDMFHKFYPNVRSPIKLKLSVPIVGRDNCTKILQQLLQNDKFQLGPKQICAGGQMLKDTCAGDSGGPLMHFDKSKSRWVAYGIVSYGFTKCGLVGHPGVYTNILEYLDWIKITIENF